MKSKILQTEIWVYDALSDLPADDQQLLNKAMEASGHAYAPYSKFWEGAALLLSNGEIITGNNQENAAYPSGLCAERTALFYAGATFPKASVTAIAIAARHAESDSFLPITPCGACRQVLSEYEGKQPVPMRLIMKAAAGQYFIIPSVESLLPVKFSKDNLAS